MTSRIESKTAARLHDSRTRRMTSPVGDLRIVADATGALTAIEFVRPDESAGTDGPTSRVATPDSGQGDRSTDTDADPALDEAERQLEEYFAGRRREFGLTFAPGATTFAEQVRSALLEIPFGSTISYSALARRLGNASAVRAVARANATNPLAIVVPCHRVVGARGELTGYGGGLPAKRWLLAHEGALLDV